MSTHSHRIVRLVRLDDTEPDAADWVGRSDGPGLAIHDVDCATRRDLAESGFDQAEPRREITFWWELFAFFMEGFALYGAALHPTAAVPVHTMLVAKRKGRPHEDDDEPPEPVMKMRKLLRGTSANFCSITFSISMHFSGCLVSWRW